MNGDLPSMAGYYDPPDQPEPKEVIAEFTLDELFDLGEDGITDSLIDEIGEDAEIEGDLELVGLSEDGRSIRIRAYYHPGEPDHSDEAYEKWRDERDAPDVGFDPADDY